MRRGGGPALEDLARDGDEHSIKFSVGSSLQFDILNVIKMLITI